MSRVLSRPSISSRVMGAYGILILVSASHAVAHMYTSLMPLIYPLAMQEFHFNYSQLGILIGIGTIIGGLTQLAFGYFGRFALRKTLLAAQNWVTALFLGLIALTTGYLPFLGANIGARIAQSPQHPVGNSLVADTFGKKLRGSAFAINFAGGNIGAVAVPMVATFLILQVGWRWTVAIFAIPSVLIAMLLTGLIDEEKSPMAAGERSTGNPVKEIKQILSGRTVLLIFAASIVAAGGRGLGVIMSYVPLYLRNGLNLDAPYVGVLFTVLMVGSVAGPLIAGRLSDLYGRRALLFATYILATISTTVLSFLTGNSWLMPVVMLVLGCASYAESPILQTFIADASRYGSRDLAFGLYFAIISVAGSLWTALLGYLVDTQGFVFAFHIMALSYIVAGLLIIPTREQGDDDAVAGMAGKRAKAG